MRPVLMLAQRMVNISQGYYCLKLKIACKTWLDLFAHVCSEGYERVETLMWSPFVLRSCHISSLGKAEEAK